MNAAWVGFTRPTGRRLPVTEIFRLLNQLQSERA